jgi:hypothetical protein
MVINNHRGEAQLTMPIHCGAPQSEALLPCESKWAWTIVSMGDGSQCNGGQKKSHGSRQEREGKGKKETLSCRKRGKKPAHGFTRDNAEGWQRC